MTPSRLSAAVAALVLVFAALGALGGRSTAAAAPDAPQPSGIPGHWNVLFDDEFDGTLNPAWCPGWFGQGSTDPINATEIGPYLTSNVTVSGGTLNLREDGRDGALVSTNPNDGCHPDGTGLQFTYGAVEFRAWLPAGPGGIANWPALWLNGQQWPQDGEIDVLEGLGGAAGAYYHYGTGGQDWHGDNGVHVPGNWSGGWHTFGVSWQPDQGGTGPAGITYYYDGRPVWQTTAGVVDSPMYLVLDDTVNSGDPVTPSTMRIDYVRVWQ